MASKANRTDSKTGESVTRRQSREDERVIREARKVTTREWQEMTNRDTVTEQQAARVVYLLFFIIGLAGVYFTWGWIGGSWLLLGQFSALYVAFNLGVVALKGLVT